MISSGQQKIQESKEVFDCKSLSLSHTHTHIIQLQITKDKPSEKSDLNGFLFFFFFLNKTIQKSEASRLEEPGSFFVLCYIQSRPGTLGHEMAAAAPSITLVTKPKQRKEKQT